MLPEEMNGTHTYMNALRRAQISQTAHQRAMAHTRTHTQDCSRRRGMAHPHMDAFRGEEWHTHTYTHTRTQECSWGMTHTHTHTHSTNHPDSTPERNGTHTHTRRNAHGGEEWHTHTHTHARMLMEERNDTHHPDSTQRGTPP